MSVRRRIAYVGTPAMAVAPLRALVDAGHEVVHVVTGVDKRRARGGTVSPTPVKAAALELGLPVSHELADVLGCGADLGVVVAFGRIIPVAMLERLPMLNLHFSLLPRWRGAAPVERAILAGDTETGVCVMQIDVGLDTGGVLACERMPIGAHETAAGLRERLVDAGSRLLVATLAAELPVPVPQEGEPLLAAKIHPADLFLDRSFPAERLSRIVRVGGAWTTFRGRRVKVLEAVSCEGAVLGLEGLRPVTVQPEGKGPMPFDDWQRGVRPLPDELFG